MFPVQPFSKLSLTMKAPLCFLACFLAVFSLVSVSAKPAKQKTIAETIATNRIMTKMAALVQAAELTDFLSSKNTLTMFAPTDSAFSRIPLETQEALLRPENKERLQHILLHLIINGKRWTGPDLAKVKALVPCDKSPLTVKVKQGIVYLDKARIIHADIKCQNGILVQIDTLLLPPESTMPPLVIPPAPLKALPVSAAELAAPPPASTGTNAAPVGVQ